MEKIIPSGDYVELHDNDTFKDRPFRVEMSNGKKLMINTSIGGVTSSSIIPYSLVKKHITEKVFNGEQEELKQQEELFSPDLFKVFNG